MSNVPVATKWYFHDSPTQLDDPNAPIPTALQGPPTSNNISDAALDPVFAVTSSVLGSIAPSSTWQAFSPADVYIMNNAIDQWNARQADLRESQLSNSNENTFKGKVAVGIDRLYEVNFGTMNLDPIYWQRFRVSSNVHCASWFFCSTLGPIDPQWEQVLEQAFLEIEPWTETYLAELEAAREVPEAIDRLCVKVLLKQGTHKIKCRVVFNVCLGDDVSGPEEKNNNSAEQAPQKSWKQKYCVSPVAHVYLEPGLLSFIPSSPTPAQLISALIDGETPAQLWFSARRGFLWEQWKKHKNLMDRPSDDPHFVPEKVTQLVLVLHGIGQKLSERVEGFNFTYAVNILQINMNKCLSDSNVLRHIPEKHGRILALPVNWRRRLNFDEFRDQNTGCESVHLQDIMMRSIPTVRKLVNDILLDIPYYMSRHKNLFQTAAVKEANRVFDLFIRHNPDFETIGTVHMLGHSLGSVIGADLLNLQDHRSHVSSKDSLYLDHDGSQTSTSSLEEENDASTPSPERLQLHFKTYNYFMAGSPLPLFLLMDGANLQSRRLFNQQHPSHEGRYPYGCFEAHNIYNIMHHSDPVSTFLGPLVSKHYNSLLKVPDLPTKKRLRPVSDPVPGIFDTISAKLPRFSKSKQPVQPEKEAEDEVMPIVELENRDFEKEYQGETNMYAVNENGQVDWVIPLTASFDNQYLSMLTAHSGYWDNLDFACMIVVECFRKPGRDNTLQVYRAVRRPR